MLNLEAEKGVIDKAGVNIPDYEVVTPSYVKPIY